jgi:hypothetical protein
VQAGHGRDRHVWLHGLLNQPELLIGCVAAALAAGDDFNARRSIGIGVRPGETLGPSLLCPVSGRLGPLQNVASTSPPQDIRQVD